MNRSFIKRGGLIFGLITALLFTGAMCSEAAIQGINGPTFNLTAKQDMISTADGGSILIWGFANGTGRAQYPGPTLIVNQGDLVTIDLTNQLPTPVSIVFPGQAGVTATLTSGTWVDGALTKDANPGAVVRYTFTAQQPGTYTYHSGTNPDLQIEMGLVGALIVRPSGYNPLDPSTYKAYNHDDSKYTREFLFILSEMDPRIHEAIEFGDLYDTTTWWPVYWFINGRTAPDTMSAANAYWLPTQPYNIMPRFHPGEKVLLRIVGGGRDLHPYHTHGNHVRVIARDGKLLSSAPGAGADLSRMEFTVTSLPGGTVDAIFQWTGEKMGWDIYGTGPDFEHTCNGISVNAANPASPGFDPVTNEYCPDHGKPFPVTIPGQLAFTFGPFYSGSPYLGAGQQLPPGEGGLNPNAGFVFMWHSHNENEIVNNNVFPGGMLTMVIVEHPNVEIME